MTEHEPGSGTDVLSDDAIDLKEPSLFKVFLLNDDYTTMEFVVSILESVFKKSPSESVRVMLHVHNKGRGLCGIYPKQIAETKLDLVHQKARADGFPLRCVMEEA